MRYERTQKALQELQGVELSQGTINRIMGRAGRAADEALAPIKEAICHSAVVNSDETAIQQLFSPPALPIPAHTSCM